MEGCREDCFAYHVDEKGKDACRALNCVECRDGGHCAFYKTRERHEADLRKYPMLEVAK